jgi:hypothetical protein
MLNKCLMLQSSYSGGLSGSCCSRARHYAKYL